MSVYVSSLSAATVDQFPGPDGAPEPVPADLLVPLGSVPDPRTRRGVRHRFTAIVGIGVCAVLSGATSFTAIAEWPTT